MKGILTLLEPSGYDKLMRCFYEKYKEMGYMESPDDFRQFMEEMSIQRHVFDENFLRDAASASRAKKPLKRKILKLVRFEGNEGGEFIRFSSEFTSENKHGELVGPVTVGKMGVWEEPVFKKRYDREIEEYVDTLEISHTIQHCDYPWKPEVVKELSKDFSKKAEFMILDGSRKYTIDRDAWCNDPREAIIPRLREEALIGAKSRMGR